MTSLSHAGLPADAASYITDITVQNFMPEVVQASLSQPVLVYFTATWCGPCKQYGPLLEKVVKEAKGRLKLARVDIDKSPQLAQQFRVQSVPMVYIFFQGQPLDAFAGPMQESQLKQMLAQFLEAGPEEQALQVTLEHAQQLLADGNADDAVEAFAMILAQDDKNIEALTGLARCFIAQKHFAKAEQVLDQVAEEQKGHESVAGARAALALAKSLPEGADAGALGKKIAANPLDHQARYDLAGLLFAGGRQEEAINELLAVIAKHKDWNEGAARARLLTFFEALGHVHPLTMHGRRKLSSLLFI